MTEQLSMFEPTGQEVFVLIKRHEQEAQRNQDLADSLNARGWTATARSLALAASRSQALAAELLMLAEFEALGELA